MTAVLIGTAAPEAARRVGIVGAGVIGGGWALHYLRMGFDVDVYDPLPAAHADLLRMVEASWPLLARMGLRDGASPDRLTFHDTLAAAVADADLVQENAPEDGPVKRRVLADIDRAARPGMVIASSTSGFAMTMLQADCEHPERCVVGHPFNPPYLIPVVEVVGGSRTDPAAVDWLVGFYAGTGKRPLRLSRELPGFVGNRLQEALWREGDRRGDRLRPGAALGADGPVPHLPPGRRRWRHGPHAGPLRGGAGGAMDPAAGAAAHARTAGPDDRGLPARGGRTFGGRAGAAAGRLPGRTARSGGALHGGGQREAQREA
jgi:hypothetical protein